MPRVPTVRAADLDRVLKALAKAGLVAGQVVVRPGGEVVITPKPAPPAAAAAAAADESLTAETLPGEVSDLDRFRQEKRQRGLRAAEET